MHKLTFDELWFWTAQNIYQHVFKVIKLVVKPNNTRSIVISCIICLFMFVVLRVCVFGCADGGGGAGGGTAQKKNDPILVW